MTRTNKHEVRCHNPECPSVQHNGRAALHGIVEDGYEAHITVVWRCRRCKRRQRTPLPLSQRGRSPAEETE